MPENTGKELKSVVGNFSLAVFSQYIHKTKMTQLFLSPFWNAELPPSCHSQKRQCILPHALTSLQVSLTCPPHQCPFLSSPGITGELHPHPSCSCFMGYRNNRNNLLGCPSASSLQFQVWNPVLPHALRGSHVVLNHHLGILQERKGKADFSDPLMSQHDSLQSSL